MGTLVSVRRCLPSRRLFFRSATSVAIVALFLGSAQIVRADNNYYHCDFYHAPGLHAAWSSASQTTQRPSTWDSSYTYAIDNSMNHINRNTDFTWNRYDRGTVVVWMAYGSPDKDLAGVAHLAIATSGCQITDATLYFNFAHFGTAHTVDQKQCTAIHEWGHGMGLMHDFTNLVVMNDDHNYRCHENLVRYLTEADKSDVNGLY